MGKQNSWKVEKEEEEKRMIENNGGIRPGKRWPQYLAASLATLGTICAGTVTGWSSPALPYLQQISNTTNNDAYNYSSEHNHSVTHEMEVTEAEASWIVSLLPLGALMGALFAGHVANMIGRKRLLLLLSLLYTIGWVLIIIAGKSVPLIFIARFISGIALGAGSVITPIYCEEIAEVSIRGSLGVLYDIQVNHGILWAYVIGAYLPYLWLCIGSAVISVVFFLTFVWMPETPIYLASKGRIKEAEEVLRWLRGAKYINGYDVGLELERIQIFVSQCIKEPLSYGTESRNTTMYIISKVKDIRHCVKSFSSSATSKAVKIIACLMIFRQLSGINAVIFYTVDIFNDAGSTVSPFVATIIVGFIQVIATYIPSLIIDRIGRRVLLLISDVTMAVCQIMLAAYFYLKNNQIVDAKTFGWLPLASLATFMFGFNLGFGPIPWVMMAELVPNESKSWAGGLGVSVSWLLVFIITNLFESMEENLGPVITFGVFGGMCIIGSISVAFVVPETKGKSREEIQRQLKNK